MAACVSVDSVSGILSVVFPQPITLDSCAFVIVTSTEFSISTSVVDSATVSSFFFFGFALVLSGYLSGWAVSQLLTALRQARR